MWVPLSGCFAAQCRHTHPHLPLPLPLPSPPAPPGSEQWSGIIPDLWPGLPDPLPWYLQRTAVLTWVTLAVSPTLAPRTLGGVAPISIFSVVCSFLCVAAVVTLCVIQLVNGEPAAASVAALAALGGWVGGYMGASCVSMAGAPAWQAEGVGSNPCWLAAPKLS